MATNTWNGGGSGNNWSTTGNWSLGHAPLSSEDVVFDATSTKNCTIDPSSVSVNSITCATGYGAGVLTASPGITVNIAADLSMVGATTIVFGVGSVWNIAGSIDPNTTSATNKSNYAGCTINLSGVGKTWGVVSSVSVSPSPGVVNILPGASYDQENGEIGGIDFHNYGTLTSTSELNMNRATNRTARIYNHSTGVIGGVGSIIFTANAQWIQQDGVVNILNLGIIAVQASMSLVPATYACQTFTIYLQGGNNQTFFWSAGTYNFTGTASVVVFDDGGANVTLDNRANATLNFSQASFNLTSAGGGLAAWKTGANGSIVLKNSAVTLKCNGLTLDAITVGAGATLTLGAALFCTSLNVTAGTFNAASFNVTLRDNLVVANPGQFAPAGLNGSTWTVGGSLLAQGVNGTHLNWQATAGWTLTVVNGPVNTANADYVDVKNCTAGGGKTVQAVNCADAGGNTGWNFAATAGTRKASSVATRTAQTLAAGSHTLEADLVGTTITASVDGVQVLSYAGATLNQSVGKYGVASYYDGTYQQCPLDNFSVPLAGAPAAPAALAVSSAELVTWHVATGATAYEVSRSPHGANTWTVLYTGAGTSYQGTAPLIAAYDYRIRASNANGFGPYSSLVTRDYTQPVVSAYWAMEEASGDALDLSANAMTLTNHNNPASTTGKVGNCRSLANAKWFTRPSEAKLVVAEKDFTYACWFRTAGTPPDFGSLGNKASDGLGSGFGFEWRLCYRSATGKLQFAIFTANADTANTVTSDVAVNDGAWHLAVAWLDMTAATISIQIDNGNIVSAAKTLTMTAGVADFIMGLLTGVDYFHGDIDEVLLAVSAVGAGGVLTAGQRAELWNGGAGKTWPLSFA